MKNKFGKVPDNINAAFVWNYDDKLYFFKNRFVYRIDEKKMLITVKKNNQLIGLIYDIDNKKIIQQLTK